MRLVDMIYEKVGDIIDQIQIKCVSVYIQMYTSYYRFYLIFKICFGSYSRTRIYYHDLHCTCHANAKIFTRKGCNIFVFKLTYWWLIGILQANSNFFFHS